MKLKVYVDIFGRMGVAETFPDDEAHWGLVEMLDHLIQEDFYGDTHQNLKSGFYTAHLEICKEHENQDGEADSYLQIRELTPLAELETDIERNEKLELLFAEIESLRMRNEKLAAQKLSLIAALRLIESSERQRAKNKDVYSYLWQVASQVLKELDK